MQGGSPRKGSTSELGGSINRACSVKGADPFRLTRESNGYLSFEPHSDLSSMLSVDPVTVPSSKSSGPAIQTNRDRSTHKALTIRDGDLYILDIHAETVVETATSLVLYHTQLPLYTTATKCSNLILPITSLKNQRQSKSSIMMSRTIKLPPKTSE